MSFIYFITYKFRTTTNFKDTSMHFIIFKFSVFRNKDINPHVRRNVFYSVSFQHFQFNLVMLLDFDEISQGKEIWF